MKKYMPIIVLALLIPTFVHAAWWNPLTWFKKPAPLVQVEPVSAPVAPVEVKVEPVVKPVVKTPVVAKKTVQMSSSTVVPVDNRITQLEEAQAKVQAQLDAQAEKEAIKKAHDDKIDAQVKVLKDKYAIAKNEYDALVAKDKAEIEAIKQKVIPMEDMRGEISQVVAKYAPLEAVAANKLNSISALINELNAQK